MRLGLAARLALVFSVLVATTALLTTVAGVVSTSAEVRSDVDRFLRDRADEIVSGDRQSPSDRNGGRRRDRQSNDSEPLGEGSEETIDPAAVRSAVDDDAIVQSLAADGTVSPGSVLLPVTEDDLKLASGPGPTLLRTVSIDGVEYRMITRHIEGGGAVQVARDLDGTNDLLSGIRSRMLIAGIIMSLGAAGAGWFLARGTIRPLRRLTDSVETIAQTQDLSLTVGLDRSDEIGRLAKGFDRMLGALKLSREQQHRLVHDAAHELRTPLTSIHANVELLSRAPDLDPEIRQETFASVRSELSQLNALFTEIIELATDARDAPDHQSLDLAAVVASAVTSFESRSRSPVELNSEPSPVVGHAPSLERAVANLLGNAEKYSPPGSLITVDVGGGTVAITDRGPGIPAEEREQVFDRFYRRDESRSQPGSGLGLAIVKKIVEEHGGRPWITAGPEGGARAGFTLPTGG